MARLPDFPGKISRSAWPGAATLHGRVMWAATAALAFSLAVGAERWIGPRLGRRLLSYQPGDDGTPVIDQQPGPRPIGYHGDEDAPQPAE